MAPLGGSENWAWKRIELHTSAHQDNHLRTLNPKYYNSLRLSSLVESTSKVPKYFVFISYVADSNSCQSCLPCLFVVFNCLDLAAEVSY